MLVSVINFTVWFAITFDVYLQTHLVFATVLPSAQLALHKRAGEHGTG